MGLFTKNELIDHLLAGFPVHRVIEIERERTHLRSHVRIALGNGIPADTEGQIDVDVEQIPHTIRIRYPLPLAPRSLEAVKVYFEKSGFVPVLSYFEVTGEDKVVVETDLDGDHNPWICQISDADKK